jgi:hypothetical protein
MHNGKLTCMFEHRVKHEKKDTDNRNQEQIISAR